MIPIDEHVRNYYEHLVIEYITQQVEGKEKKSLDFMADVACVALNHLPPRYIRYEVDMAFYLSPDEYIEIHDKVKKSVEEAIAFVRKRRRNE